MTIYLQHGLVSNQLKEKKADYCDFRTICEIVYREMQQPAKNFKTSDEKNSYKRNNANYFIAGKMSELKRKNENVKARTLLLLDIDDLEIDYHVFISKLKNINHNELFQFLIYPTISHESNTNVTKNNTNVLRARIIINLSREVNSQEYATLVQAMTHFFVELAGSNNYHADISNKTWGQLQGLYVKTAANESCTPVRLGERALDVDNALAKIQQYTPKKNAEENIENGLGGAAVARGERKAKKYNFALELLEYLMMNKSPKKGERNQWYFERWAIAVRQYKKDYITAEQLKAVILALETINQNSDDALSDEEIESILRAL